MRSCSWLPLLPLLVLSLVRPAGADLAEVADLVARVSQANLIAHVAALEGDRSSSAAQAAAAAYIRGQLESHGQTVTSQAVAGSENLTATLTGLVAPDDEFVLGAHPVRDARRETFWRGLRSGYSRPLRRSISFWRRIASTWSSVSSAVATFGRKTE